MVGRLNALLESIKTVEGGIVFADWSHIRLAVDLVLHAKPPKDSVDNHATKALTFKVGGGSHGRAEESVCLALGVFQFASPGDRHGRFVDALNLSCSTVFLLLPGDGLGVRLERIGYQATHENRGIGRWGRFVSVAIGKDISCAHEDGVVFVAFLHNSTATLALVAAPVTDPSFAQNFFAKAVEVLLQQTSPNSVFPMPNPGI